MKNIIFLNKTNHRAIRTNALFLLFWGILLLGVIFGAVTSKNTDANTFRQLDFILRTNYDIKDTQGIWFSFIASFASSTVFLFFLLLMGLSVWGSFLTIAVPFFKGYGYGIATGVLYGNYGLYGILYNVLIVLPGAFLSAIIIVAATKVSFQNSVSLTKATLKPTCDNPYSLSPYLISMMWCLILCAFCAVAESICFLCFSWIFHF